MNRSAAILLLLSTLASPTAIALCETPLAIADAPSFFAATPAREELSYKLHPPSRTRWYAPAVTVEIDSSIEAIGPSAREAVERAFGTWLASDGELPRVTFESVSNTSAAVKLDGKNTVLYGPITVPGHESELAITLVYSDTKTGKILETDVIINSHFNFDVLADDSGPGCKNGAYDLQNVMTHEVGHFFGLGEDAADQYATMYARTDLCELHKRMLTHADTTAIAGLYSGAR